MIALNTLNAPFVLNLKTNILTDQYSHATWRHTNDERHPDVAALLEQIPISHARNPFTESAELLRLID